MRTSIIGVRLSAETGYCAGVTIGAAKAQLACMSAEWDAVLARSASDPALLVEWEQSIASMHREVDFLRARSRWRGGHRTLMHALGIEYRELYLTARSAWLLGPDGWHGLGSLVLRGLLIRLRWADETDTDLDG